MSIEPIGLLTFVVSLICLQLGYQATAATLVVATLFGSAAAILIGGANIPPAHLLLAFMAASTFTRRVKTAYAFKAMRFPEPGFWLICLVIYGLISAFLMPRLLAGTTPIIPLGLSSDYAETGSTVPLGPVSSNLTQSIYLVGNFTCFIMIVAIASTRAGFATIAGALVAYAAGNVLFALLDIVTYNTGTQWLMEPIRNSTYTLHVDEEISGLKRIVGSFTEASAFAGSTLSALGFVGTLWVCGRRPALTGTLALASLALVVLSTSSTGLAGTPPLLVILYITALARRAIDFRRPFASAAILCAPLAVVAVILAAQLNDEAWKPIRDYMDVLIFSKAGSDSAAERSSWNTFALQNFVDSYGLGVGLGTTRASSFPVALLSNVGLLGTIFYVLFAVSAFVRRRGIPRTFYSDVRLAGRNSCLGLLIGATFAGTSIDQGLLFYVLAGMACAEPERKMAVFSPVTIRPSGARI
jgi:hypothetical protein